MRIFERAGFPLLLFTAEFFGLSSFVNIGQFEEEKNNGQNQGENTQSEERHGDITGCGLAGFFAQNDTGNKNGSNRCCDAVQRLRKRHAKSAAFRSTQYHNIRVGNQLKHYNTHGNNKHAAQENVVQVGAAAGQAEIVCNKAAGNDYETQDQSGLIADFAHHQGKRNGKAIGSVKRGVNEVALGVIQIESVFQRFNHRIVHRGNETNEETNCDDDNQSERIVRSLFL